MSNRGGLVHDLQAHPHEVPYVDKLHQPASIAGQDDLPARAKPVPKKCFAIKRISRPVDVGRAQRDHRQSDSLMQSEQRTFTHGLVADIELRSIVWRERIALVMIQAV